MATTKVATPKVTNADWWNLARALDPTFASHTAEATANLFTERGFSEIQKSGLNTLDNMFGIVLPYYLNLVNISHAKDPLDRGDVGEYFESEYGEFTQRMAVNSIKPISPAYRDLKDGPGPDPFVIRTPTLSDRFFQPNFDYQSLVTIPDDWATKRIFTSEYGFSEVLAGIYAGMENGYTIQKYVAKKEAINSAINDPALQNTQIVPVSLPDNPTEEQLVQFILAVKNVISFMDTTPQTSAFNALGFADMQDPSRLRMLVRAGFKNKVDMIAARNSFNRDVLNLPIPVVEVSDFGGLTPLMDGETAYPVYSSIGEEIGFSKTKGATTPDTGTLTYNDPNANVAAVLLDKGAIFEIRRNPYIVEPIRNPRGRYTNSWASSPNNTIAYDRLRTTVKFVNTPEPDET